MKRGLLEGKAWILAAVMCVGCGVFVPPEVNVAAPATTCKCDCAYRAVEPAILKSGCWVDPTGKLLTCPLQQRDLTVTPESIAPSESSEPAH
jgi:hypothetical protein